MPTTRPYLWPLFLLGGTLLGGVLLAPGAARADVKAGHAALLKGAWSEAETEFKGGVTVEKGPALLGLGELYLTTGRYAEALDQATQASLIGPFRSRALCLAGEVDRATGKYREAQEMFRAALTAEPRNLRARVYLGIAQQETGQRAPAEKTLDTFFQEFNAGKIDKTRADQLTYTAMAARRLGVWKDANETFQDAAEKDPQFLLANLEWGDLFALKYNAQEAANCYGAVLKVNPKHPLALAGMARIKAENSGDVTGARALADAALKSNPHCVPALDVKARLALDDEAFADAEQFLKEALAVNPADAEALALLGASRFLQQDETGYEAQRKKALEVNPADAEFYVHVGEMADRQHLYTEAVQLNREAVKLDPKNASALAALGTGLLRLGMAHEKEGLQYVKQAFDRDPFNVRTLNTLNLFEQVVAKEYVTKPGGIFLYRFNAREAPMLARYVPPLMQRAWDLYVKKYGFTPRNPITVELFAERQHYGARTVGLPELGAQGTCFGELITAMSPACAEANWEQVLWHELAHVFHIQLSHNRVSRWFTEGLAEYETNVERPYWKREYGREIYSSLVHGDLWKISELSGAFTHPERENGVLIAYQQSSLVIHYLAESFGFPKIVEALKLYGAGQHDAEVLQAVTGKSLDDLDRGFREWLRKRYACYASGFFWDPAAYKDGAKLKAEAEAHPTDAGAQARYAASLQKDASAAQAQARKALQLDEKNGLARFVLAETLLAKMDPAGARKEFETLLAGGTDGYEIRMALGRMALAEGELETAAKHLAAAKKFDPDRTEPYQLLMTAYDDKDRRAELLRETEAYLDLQEHDHDAARLLLDRFSSDRKWADIARVAPRVIEITPSEAYVHQQYGIALTTLNRPREAAFELESALIMGVRKPAHLRALLAKQYLALGEKVKAKAAAQEALKEDPTDEDAKAVLKSAG